LLHTRKAWLLVSALASLTVAWNAEDVAASLRDIVESGRLSDLRWPDFSDYEAHLVRFYEPAGWTPAWLRDGQATPQALALIQQFQEAWKKGLEPEDYDASRWNARLESLKGPGADPARFDAAMSVCAMRLVSDLRIGRINPQQVRFGLSVDAKKYDLARFLREQLMPASDVGSVVDETEPPYPTYRRTRAALVRYMEIAPRDDGETLPVPERPIDPGQIYAGIPRLDRLLRLVGDLPPDAPLPNLPIYDGALVEAVKRFQRRHGLDEDGRLGPGTIRELNVPLTERVRQLQLTLERWRWLPPAFSSPPIIVNIPDFGLRALDENNKIVMNMRVVVGRAMRTETPVFARDMTHIVFRPYWNVPPSIRRAEIVPAIERDRNYIAAKNYEITTHDGKVVTDGQVSDDVLAQLTAGSLAVRQKPGTTNALGLVKLMFPNEFNVYLHSTPAPALFSKSRRDFSHGCIRVERPDDLAAWVLRGNPDWTLERVRAAMQSGADNVTVKLTRPVPVFIVYGTAIAQENGEVHFYDDIYGHDATLAQALARGHPYPW
jgi:L,D-transpeptidase YcbB